MIPLSWRIGGAVGAVSVVLAAYHFLPVYGPHARLEKAHAATADAQGKAASWEASFRHAEALRVEEANVSINAVNEANSICDRRVAEARRSAKVIRDIVEKPTKLDPNGCAVRSLVDPGSLRDAIQPR